MLRHPEPPTLPCGIVSDSAIYLAAIVVVNVVAVDGVKPQICGGWLVPRQIGSQVGHHCECGPNWGGCFHGRIRHRCGRISVGVVRHRRHTVRVNCAIGGGNGVPRDGVFASGSVRGWLGVGVGWLVVLVFAGVPPRDELGRFVCELRHGKAAQAGLKGVWER